MDLSSGAISCPLEAREEVSIINKIGEAING